MVEARKPFSKLPKDLAQHPEIGAVQITCRSKPVLAVSDPEMMAAIRQSVRDLEKGKRVLA